MARERLAHAAAQSHDVQSGAARASGSAAAQQTNQAALGGALQNVSASERVRWNGCAKEESLQENLSGPLSCPSRLYTVVSCSAQLSTGQSLISCVMAFGRNERALLPAWASLPTDGALSPCDCTGSRT